MNRKGQLAMVGIMLGFMIVATAIVMIDPLKIMIDQARTDIGCSGGSLTTGERLGCLVVDFTFFAFLGTALSVGVAWVGVKKLRSRSEE